MPITQPRYATPGLVAPNGSVEGPLGNLFRALCEAAGTATTVDTSALVARIAALENNPVTIQGDGVTGSPESGYHIANTASDGVLASQIFGS